MKKIYAISGLIILLLALQAFNPALTAPATQNSQLSVDLFTITGHDHSKPNLKFNSSEKVIIETDYMTIMIVGTEKHIVPNILFWYTADDNGTEIKFGIDFKFLIEFYDTNGDGAFQHNETVPAKLLDLDRAFWSYQIVGPYNDSETGTTIDIYLTVTDWLGYDDHMPLSYGDMPEHPGPPEQGEWWNSVNVTFGIHIYEQDKLITLDDNDSSLTTIVFGGYEAKIDFNVTGWPFESFDNMLAVAIYIEDEASDDGKAKENHRISLEERDGPRIIDPETAGNETESGFEHRFTERNNITQQLQFINDKNVTHGYFKWLNNSLMINENGTCLMDVNASYISDGSMLRLYLAFPAFNGTLYYDPVLGMNVESGDVPGNNPPNIIDIIISQLIRKGEMFSAKAKVSDDFGIDTVSVLLVSPSDIEFEYEAVFDGEYYTVSLSTDNWAIGTWTAKIKVTDIYGATTISEEYTITVEETGTKIFNIDIMWFAGGIALGVAIAILFLLKKRK